MDAVGDGGGAYLSELLSLVVVAGVNATCFLGMCI